jgi:hypothetical protein
VSSRRNSADAASLLTLSAQAEPQPTSFAKASAWTHRAPERAITAERLAESFGNAAAAALAGKRKGVMFDPELLFVAGIFHDYGLTAGYGQSHLRYEVDGANAAREFLGEQTDIGS